MQTTDLTHRQLWRRIWRLARHHHTDRRQAVAWSALQMGRDLSARQLATRYLDGAAYYRWRHLYGEELRLGGYRLDLVAAARGQVANARELRKGLARA